jgi:hypothetical protein
MPRRRSIQQPWDSQPDWTRLGGQVTPAVSWRNHGPPSTSIRTREPTARAPRAHGFLARRFAVRRRRALRGQHQDSAAPLARPQGRGRAPIRGDRWTSQGVAHRGRLSTPDHHGHDYADAGPVPVTPGVRLLGGDRLQGGSRRGFREARNDPEAEGFPGRQEPRSEGARRERGSAPLRESCGRRERLS